jgi:hypothetical protein
LLILSYYKKNLKIKNRYNITMAYKTKKYRKKRLRGGRTINENMEMLGSIGLQMGENFLFYIVSTFASMVGVDPNKSLDNTISDISKKASALEMLLSSPEGQQLMVNITDIIKIITKEIVSPALTSLGEDLADKGGKIVQHASQAIMNTLEEIPGPGTILGIIRTLTNLINIAKEGTAIGEKFFHTTNDVTTKLNAKKGEFDSLASTFNSLINRPLEAGVNGLNKLTGINTADVSKHSSTALNYGKNALNYGKNALNYGKNLMNTSGLNNTANLMNYGKNALNYGQNLMNTSGLNNTANLMNYGKNAMNYGQNLMNNGVNKFNALNNRFNNQPNMNNLNNVGNIVGGRLNNTLSEFIKPTKIQHGGGITKKHIFSRSMTRRHH